MRAWAAVCLSFIWYLLAFTGGTVGQGQGPVVIKVFVKEHSDAVLPCSISTGENLEGMLFDWRKNGQKDGLKEVFMYDAGKHYNNGFRGQDQQFKGRVSHFQDQLMNGNASIKIQNTKMADSGTYSCDFPRLDPRQTFYIELVVGTCPEPQIKVLDVTKDWSLLQCEVRGASPKPKVEWQDRAGNVLPAEKPQVLESGGSYNVTLNINVTKTGRYRCVATQEDISHQIHSEIFVFVSEKLCKDPSSVSEDPSTKEVIGLLFGGIVIGAVVLVAVLAVLRATKYLTIRFNRGPRHPRALYKSPADKGSPSTA